MMASEIHNDPDLDIHPGDLVKDIRTGLLHRVIRVEYGTVAIVKWGRRQCPLYHGEWMRVA